MMHKGLIVILENLLSFSASLPQLFFPTVVAKKTSSGECVVGFDAYRPDIRNQSTLHYPIRPSVKVDKVPIYFKCRLIRLMEAKSSWKTMISVRKFCWKPGSEQQFHHGPSVCFFIARRLEM